MSHPSAEQDPFAVEIQRLGATIIAIPTGDIDVDTVSQLRDVRRRCSPASVLVIDLSRVTFIDSRGLQLLAQENERAGALGARLVLLPGPERVQRTFALTGMDRVLHFAR